MQAQKILPSQHIYPWKMINLLMQIHPVQSVGLDFSISPPYIPVARTLLVLDDPAELLGDLRYDGVLGVAYVEDDLFVLEFLW